MGRIRGCVGLVAALSLGMAGMALPADAATKCYGATTSGVCISTSDVKYYETVVESVPLRNKSSKTVTMNCSFSQTVTRSFSASTTISASYKAELWAVAEASVSGSQSFTLTQTASQANAAGGSVTLKPGQSVVCQRTYGYYTMTTTVNSWTSSKVRPTETFKVTVPYQFGVTIRG